MKEESQPRKKETFQSSYELDSEPWEGHHLHGYALDKLLNYKDDVDPSFKFSLRQMNNRNRLDNGFWFQGTEDYAFVGLYSAPGGNKSTSSVGLVFWEGENGYQTTFEVIYKYEERPEYLDFYNDIRFLLKEAKSRSITKIDWINQFRFTVYLSSFEEFLSEFRLLLEELVDKHSLSHIRITNAKFNKSLNRILQIKKSGPPAAETQEVDTVNQVKEDEDEDKALDDDEVMAIKGNPNIKLNKDIATDQDDLNRAPFVNLLYDHYIKPLWIDTADNRESKKYQDENSYTIHINGEWGSGKSSVMKLLKNRLQQGQQLTWQVVEYNAWQNQHMEEPWWVFLDKVYKAIYRSTSRPKKYWIWLRERWWRLVSMNKGRIASFLILSCIAIGCCLLYIYTKSSDSEGIDFNPKFVVSLISIIGSVWLLITSIVNSMIPGTAQAAANYKKSARDPMEAIRKHYTDILNYTPKNVAVFIDDIDRCNPKHVVVLLEGLQNLFRTGKVLYVIAGDANWIRDSFEQEYSDLASVIAKPGQTLGNFFLEKTIQQSVNLPRIAAEVKKEYWNSVLTGGASESESDQKDTQDYIRKMNIAESDEDVSDIIEEAPEQIRRKLREKAAEKYASAEVRRDIEHSLASYAQYLHSNPRSIKRLANNLALEKAVSILEGSLLKNNDLSIRWAIFRNDYPMFAIDLISDKIKWEEVEKSIGKDNLLINEDELETLKNS